jgi:hypothetical protein
MDQTALLSMTTGYIRTTKLCKDANGLLVMIQQIDLAPLNKPTV